MILKETISKLQTWQIIFEKNQKLQKTVKKSHNGFYDDNNFLLKSNGRTKTVSFPILDLYIEPKTLDLRYYFSKKVKKSTIPKTVKKSNIWHFEIQPFFV